MSRRAMVCVVNAERGTVDPAILNCGDQSHHHISQADARIGEGAGEYEWVKEPRSRGDKGVVRVLKENPRYRGLSCKVGEALVMGLEDNQPWARLMRSEQGRKIYRRKKIQVGGESAGVATRSVFVHLSPPEQFQAVGGT